MTLPGLPPARATALPVPPTGADDARRRGRRRLAATAGALVGVTTVLTAVAVVPAGGRAVDRLQVAVGLADPPAPTPAGLPGLLSGRVTDPSGRPLARVAVLPADLDGVLTRTDRDGRYTAPCVGDLVVAAYAPSRPDGVVRERSPGAGELAWRRVRGTCGARVDVVLPPGGVVVGTGPPGQDVRLERVRGRTREVAPEGPVFAGRVGPDGTFRVGALDTGRYRLVGAGDEPVLVDVDEGRTTRVR